MAHDGAADLAGIGVLGDHLGETRGPDLEVGQDPVDVAAVAQQPRGEPAQVQLRYQRRWEHGTRYHPDEEALAAIPDHDSSQLDPSDPW